MGLDGCGKMGRVSAGQGGCGYMAEGLDVSGSISRPRRHGSRAAPLLSSKRRSTTHFDGRATASISSPAYTR